MYFILQCIKFVSKLQHSSMKKKKWHMKVTEKSRSRTTDTVHNMNRDFLFSPPLTYQATHCVLQRQLYLQCNIQNDQIKKGF